MENKSIELSKILETEYSEDFDKKRQDAMCMSFFKYGPVADNYKKFGCINAVGSLEKRLGKFKETGNKEMLVDVANFAMIEYMYSQHPDAHYQGTDCEFCKIDGFGVNQLE